MPAKNSLVMLRNNILKLLERRRRYIDVRSYNSFERHIFTVQRKKLDNIKLVLKNIKTFDFKLTKKNFNDVLKNIVNKNDVLDSEQDSNEIIINVFNRRSLDFWIHSNEIYNMMVRNPNTIITHEVKFFNSSNEEVNNYMSKVLEKVIDGLPLKVDFIQYKTKKEIEQDTQYIFSIAGSNGIWIPDDFIYTDNNNYVKLITKAYKKLNNVNEQLRILQRYAFNDSGTCVYDGLLEYFSKYEDTKNKIGKAIYNKLINKHNKYAKSYNIEEMEELGKEINCSFTIVDLINNSNIEINKGNNRFNISFVNTRYNHINLLKCISNVVDITTNKYNEIKKNVNFYVERFGTLLTLDGNYKINNSYIKLVDDWKKQYNINGCSIFIDSDINKFINLYDDKVHRFFKDDMIINNNLYSELDLKKAYYNYNKCSQYNGIPSGAYISCSGDGLTDDIFIKQFNNKLIGFYEVEVIHNNSMLNFLGLYGNNIKYVLFSSTIKLLLDNGIKFKYYNYVISPSIDAPFNEDFLKYIDGDELVNDNNNKDLVKAFCKVVGCMMIENKNFSIEIKPDNNDKDFYKTLGRKEDIYKIGGIYKIIKEKEEAKSLKHIALSIHAYTSTIILEQLLKMNINDVYGVKVDSIIFRKGININYNENLFKSPSNAKIEGMLKKQVDKYGLDYGLDCGINETKNEYFKPYFIDSINKINFEKSFCGEHITERVIFLGGAGGCGKTHSVLNSKNFMIKELIFSSTGWELIVNKVDEFNDVLGLSLPKLTGEMNGQKVEKYNISKFKYIVNDELTLQNKKIINTIINDNQDKFIILMGDIDEDGFYYQCSIGNNVINPSKLKCQYIQYTKNYRFDNSFNNKINEFRNSMKLNKGNTKKLYEDFKNQFGSQFFNIKDVKFGDNDVGISALQPIKNNKCLFSDEFYKLGAKEQYYIKDTVFKAGKYKGAHLDEKPEGKNYVCSLFRTIHSYQGRQLTKDNKIIILLNSLFDYNLLYTAISRARRLDQIIIIDRIK